MAPSTRGPVDEFVRFCECLNRFEVQYVVVGSEALAFHGAPRYSADFDTFVQATRANLFRVIAALEQFGLRDLAATIDAEGVEFREVLAGAVEGRYGEIEVKFIGLEALLVNKRAAGRAKDSADVAALEGRGERTP